MTSTDKARCTDHMPMARGQRGIPAGYVLDPALCPHCVATNTDAVELGGCIGSFATGASADEPGLCPECGLDAGTTPDGFLAPHRSPGDKIVGARITLLGPPPAGGSHTCDLDDDALVERLMAQHGYTVSRIWHVRRSITAGVLYTEDIYRATSAMVTVLPVR